MTTNQQQPLSRDILFAEQDLSQRELERHLDAIIAWSYARTDPSGATLEDHVREVRLHATTLRTVTTIIEATR